jgi:hypothetical protein
MGYLTRDQILKVDDIQFEDVQVPEWGGAVRVRGLTGAQRDELEASVVEQRGRKTRVNLQNLRAKLVAMAAVDEQGKRVFSDGDVAALGQKSAAALQRVFDAAQRLSGLSDQDIEELTKNSASGQSAASTSD